MHAFERGCPVPDSVVALNADALVETPCLRLPTRPRSCDTEALSVLSTVSSLGGGVHDPSCSESHGTRGGIYPGRPYPLGITQGVHLPRGAGGTQSITRGPLEVEVSARRFETLSLARADARMGACMRERPGMGRTHARIEETREGQEALGLGSHQCILTARWRPLPVIRITPGGASNPLAVCSEGWPFPVRWVPDSDCCYRTIIRKLSAGPRPITG